MSEPSTDTLPIDGPESAAGSFEELLLGVRRQLCLYTPVLAIGVYDRPELAEQLRQLVLGKPRLNVRLLLPPAGQWRGRCPQLARSIEQLSGLALRVLPPNHPHDQAEYAYGFALADQRKLLLLNDPRRCLGSFHPNSGGLRARDLQSFFDTLWEQGQPDVELRKLGI